MNQKEKDYTTMSREELIVELSKAEKRSWHWYKKYLKELRSFSLFVDATWGILESETYTELRERYLSDIVDV